MKPSKSELPLRTTLLYLLFGGLWILLSDQLLSLFFLHNTQGTIYQTIKGWFFILVSAILLYLLLRRDLAEHKRADDALQESEARFRLMFENNPAIMMLIESVSGAIKDANGAAAVFYGYPLSELREMNINDINQLKPDEVQAERMRALREERNFFNFRHRLSNGEIRSVEVHSAPITLGENTLLFSIVHDATERKKTEQELQDSQNRMKAIVDSAMDAIVSTDSNQLIVLANPAAEQMFGYGAGEMIGKPLDVLLPERFRDLHYEQVRRFGMTGVTTRSMHALGAIYGLRASGQEFPAEASISQISIGSEKVYTVIVRDITERKQAEEIALANHRFLQEILDNSKSLIYVLDADGRFILINRSLEAVIGVPRESVLGKTRAAILPPEIAAEHRANDLEVIRIGKAVTVEERNMEQDGTHTYISTRFPLYDLQGEIYAIGGLSTDITERKQAEERIQRQLQRLRALRAIDVAISSSFDMLVSLEVLLQEARTQLRVDAAAVLLLKPETLTLEYAAGSGFSSTAIQETHLHLSDGVAGRAALERREIHMEDSSQMVDDFIRRDVLKDDAFRAYFVTPLIARGEVKGVLEVYHRSTLQTNQEWLDFLEAMAGQAAIAIENTQLFENLHRSNIELEQRVLERTAELNRTNAELERANRAKDEFLATMSHELRTPLNSILGLSESLLEERRGSLNEHQQNSLRIIESSGHHLLELINDILDLSKIEAGMFDLYLQSVSVDEFCRSCLAFVKAQAVKKSISISYVNEAPVAKILADPRRLKQIVVNLLTNAVKFTPEHGRIFLQVTGDREQDLIRFSVTDTGIGIAAEDLRRLFRPFVQLDSSLNRQYRGTGLGLALVQKLADLHGGSVQVESEFGKGSQFTVSIPIKQGEIAEQGMDQSTAAPRDMEPVEKAEALRRPSAHRGLILLADDNMPNILTIGEYLESYEYKVIVAHDGLDAITKTQANHPDLILMDIQMPVINGLDAIARLRQDPLVASTPIIALTALAMPGDRERCLAAGANEYLSKPVSLKLLVRTIAAMLVPQPRAAPHGP